MKKHCVILLLLSLSIKGFGNPATMPDTISYWQVYNGGELLKEGNIISRDTRITLDKKKVLPTDTLIIKYFDDTPCTGCSAAWIIKTKKEKEIGKIEKTGDIYLVNIPTADLQALAAENRRTPLRIYFRENETGKEILLFEIEFR